MLPEMQSWMLLLLALSFLVSPIATADPTDLFLGVPYAQDTGGQNRFSVPQALNETWTDVRSAKRYGNACPDNTPAADAAYGMSENCLSINVIRPAGLEESQKLPVMLWIHGGSYQVGTSALPYYNLTYLVKRSGSGNTNLSLQDMRKALAWISENISAFGGDPNSVTIWGESAGSFAITSNLFHHSIQESGSATTAWYDGSSWYQPIYDKIVAQTNCLSAIDTLACLRTVPYSAIYPFMDSSKVTGQGFYPTVDGDIMPNYPTELFHSGRFTHIPHLYGTNSDESTDNAPDDDVINTDFDLYAFLLNSTGFDFPPSTVREIMRLYPDDLTLSIPLNTGTERFAAQGYQFKRIAATLGDVFCHSPTYIYRFNTRPFGVEHFSEVAFVFGNPLFVGPWPEYRELSRQISAQWINFIHGEDPNGVGVPVWPRYSEGSQGLNLVLQTEGQGGYLTKWARRRHV
ncbi:alpha/beta-hydrolase [Cenococcum geophilum 1.58]|uniref:alpha/beta-hydrolase n=1 Tax=Cenococcum geophilum 1.58 TaxID=794803 RepID=UPI00358E5457|nr:alpha/beta-hydrolase [Cenococcum geophilum 1.58]